MKFTIDTEEKIIYFKEPFKKDDIEYVLSILDIEGIDSWKISMEESLSKPFFVPETPNQTGPYTITCDGVQHRFTNTTSTHNIELTDIYN